MTQTQGMEQLTDKPVMIREGIHMESGEHLSTSGHKKSLVWLTIGIIVAVLVVIGIIGYFVAR